MPMIRCCAGYNINILSVDYVPEIGISVYFGILIYRQKFFMSPI